MLRRLLLLIPAVVLLPFIYLAGYGFYHGFDVPSGLASFVRWQLRLDHVRSGQQPVRADVLEVRKHTTLWQGDIDSELLAEASGLVASRHHPEQLFSINDSGNEPRIFALGKDGADMGSWLLDYPGYHDFEDIAAFSSDGQHYLVIADTGDNFYWRPSVTLLIVPEPVEDTAQPISPDRIIELTYPDGARDVESMAVDEKTGVVFLVSKRRIPAEVFEVPLEPEGDGPVEAKLIATLSGIPEPSARDLREHPWFGRNLSQPTSLDIQGRTAVVVTYKDAYLYERRRRESWGEAFSGVPDRILLPRIWGLEAGGFSGSGDSLLVTGERDDGVARSGLFEVRLED